MLLSSQHEYRSLLKNIKEQIQSSQYRTIRAINCELICLYWNIGKLILENQVREGWDSKFIDNFAVDIKLEFPDFEIVQAALAQITWYHHMALMDKVKDLAERRWYIKKTIENGWSRNVLVNQIATNLYTRQALAEKTTNFERFLPSPQSELAIETLKDPYIFDFITLKESMKELERGECYV